MYANTEQSAVLFSHFWNLYEKLKNLKHKNQTLSCDYWGSVVVLWAKPQLAMSTSLVQIPV